MNSDSFEMRTGFVFGNASSFWLLFMAVAVVLWLSPFLAEQQSSFLKTTILGAVAFLISLCLRFSYHGVQLDAGRRMIREFTSILGYRIGEWQRLPALEKLRLSKARLSSVNTPNGVSPTFRSNSILYKITLVTQTDAPDHVIRLADKEKAIESARALATLLQLEVEEIGMS